MSTYYHAVSLLMRIRRFAVPLPVFAEWIIKKQRTRKHGPVVMRAKYFGGSRRASEGIVSAEHSLTILRRALRDLRSCAMNGTKPKEFGFYLLLPIFTHIYEETKRGRLFVVSIFTACCRNVKRSTLQSFCCWNLALVLWRFVKHCRGRHWKTASLDLFTRTFVVLTTRRASLA